MYFLDLVKEIFLKRVKDLRQLILFPTQGLNLMLEIIIDQEKSAPLTITIRAIISQIVAVEWI